MDQAPLSSNKGKRELTGGTSKRLQKLRWMAGGVAHDFNNYLTAILTTAELLRDTITLEDKESSLSLVDTIAGEIFKAKAVSNQLLAFTQSQPVKEQIFAVPPFLKEVAAFALQGSAIRTTFTIEGADLLVRCDPDLLEQVLFNLLLNARQVMQDSGFIQLKVGKSSNDRICLIVADTGPGIPPDVGDKVFDVYFSTRKGGSGLGLYIARTLIERMDGSIKLLPEGPGAHFHICLPSASSGGEIDSASEPHRSEFVLENTNRPRRKIHQTELMISGLQPSVWILEDHAVQRETLSDYLTFRGYEVKAFEKGDYLLESLSQTNGTIVRIGFILDVTIEGGMGGIDVAERLREQFPDAPIILVSGYSDQGGHWEAVTRHLNIQFLAKPYRMAELEKRLADAFGNSADAPVT
jgi:two-component system cell cycle sensor histidine kinase/response regulator CckA